MNKPEISTRFRIQNDPNYWFTVEDVYLDVGCDGVTISYWEASSVTKDEKRHTYMCIEKESALAVADAIYKLFKKHEEDN